MGLRENEGLAIGHKVAPPPEPADAAGTERTDGETREFRGTSRWPIGAFVVMQFILIGAVVRAVTASDLVAALLAVVAASMDVIAFLHAKKYSLEVGPDGVRYVAGRAVVSMQWDEIAAVSHHGFGKTMRLRSHDNRSIEIDLDKFKRGGEIRDALRVMLSDHEPITEPVLLGSLIASSIAVWIIAGIAVTVLARSKNDFMHLAYGAALGFALGLALNTFVRVRLSAYRWIGWGCVGLAVLSVIVAIAWTGAVDYGRAHITVWRVLLAVLGFLSVFSGLILASGVRAHGEDYQEALARRGVEVWRRPPPKAE